MLTKEQKMTLGSVQFMPLLYKNGSEWGRLRELYHPQIHRRMLKCCDCMLEPGAKLDRKHAAIVLAVDEPIEQNFTDSEHGWIVINSLDMYEFSARHRVPA